MAMSSDTVPSEPTDVDPTVRQKRHLVLRNNLERIVCRRHTQTLEAQRRTKQTQLAREEKELRHYLHQLQREQRLLQRDVQEGDVPITEVVAADLPEESEGGYPAAVESAVINPYPVALGARVALTTGGQEPHNQASRGSRRVSVEFEDLEMQTSTGKVFPPLLSGRDRQRAPPRLQRADSMFNIRPSSSTLARDQDQECWAGDPNAIHSIRRPRKTVAQQRLSSIISRSSNKEDLSDYKAATNATGLNRSQSLKVAKSTLSAATSGALSRSHSWKENKRHLMKSIENMNEAFSGMDLKPARRSPSTPRQWAPTRQVFLSPQPSLTSLRDLSTSPDTKSCVWGTVEEDLRSNIEGALSTSSNLLQRRRRAKTFSHFPEDDHSLPPIAPTSGAWAGSPRAPSPACSGSPSTPRRKSHKDDSDKISRDGSFKRRL